MLRIPAIDLINGTCVRLSKGDFGQKTEYQADPIALAQSYKDAGAKRIHIIDLDAARGLPSNANIIFEIARSVGLEVQAGGGIRSEAIVEEYFKQGVDAVIIGSAAQKQKQLVKGWIQTFGSDRIIIGADVRDNKIAVDGWLEISDEGIQDFIQEYLDAGATTFLCTDILKDGMLQGTSNHLYSTLMAQFSKIQLIASGGVASIADIEQLETMNMYACVIGKALFENKISLSDLFPKNENL